MVTTVGDKIYRYYRDMEDLLAAACTRAIRNLTWQEWQQYLPGEPYRRTCPDLPDHSSVPEVALAHNGSP
jgi:AcrR family transcriptional regulator